MDNNDDSVISDEVQSRLDSLFGDSDKAFDDAKESGEPKDSPLTGLKTVLLSIDWEITDEAMDTLIDELGKLEDIYKDDKNLVLFFRLLGTAGKYIKNSKANAHPGAIKLLNSVYNSLEIVMLSESITEVEKKKILYAHVREFKELKEQIAKKKAVPAKKKEAKPAIEEVKKEAVVQEEPKVEAVVQEEPKVEAALDISNMTPQQVLTYVLSEVKQIIRDEFKAFKAELKP